MSIRHNRFRLTVLLPVVLCSFGIALSADDAPVMILREGLKSKSFWTRVHAAEYLIDRELAGEEVKTLFLAGEHLAPQEPFCRIGRHRVLIRLGDHTEERLLFLRRTALDPAAPDRIHALETLGKLPWHAEGKEAEALRRLRKDPSNPPEIRLYAAWIPDGDDDAREAELLGYIADNPPGTTESDLALDGLNLIKGPLSQETRSLLQKILLQNDFPVPSRMKAGELLLKHRIIDFPDFLRQIPDVPEDAANLRLYCRIAARFSSGEKDRKMFQKLIAGSDEELKLCAAWGLLVWENRNDPALSAKRETAR